MVFTSKLKVAFGSKPTPSRSLLLSEVNIHHSRNRFIGNKISQNKGLNTPRAGTQPTKTFMKGFTQRNLAKFKDSFFVSPSPIFARYKLWRKHPPWDFIQLLGNLFCTLCQSSISSGKGAQLCQIISTILRSYIAKKKLLTTSLTSYPGEYKQGGPV